MREREGKGGVGRAERREKRREKSRYQIDEKRKEKETNAHNKIKLLTLIDSL